MERRWLSHFLYYLKDTLYQILLEALVKQIIIVRSFISVDNIIANYEIYMSEDAKK